MGQVVWDGEFEGSLCRMECQMSYDDGETKVVYVDDIFGTNVSVYRYF